MSPTRRYSYGRYAYPASYSYYPTRRIYNTKKKNYYPLLVLALGIAIAVYGLASLPKVDPELQRQATLNPDAEIAALVFCNPCNGIDGQSVGTGKMMVVGTALKVRQLSSISGVKQIKLLGPI